MQFDYTKTNSNWKASLKFQNYVQKATENKHQPSLVEKVLNVFHNKEHNIHLQRVLFILKLYPNTRTQQQLELLKHYFETKFAYIQIFKENLNEETYMSIFREMQLETFEQHQIIFNHGDIGRKIYFLLNGEVAILIPQDEYQHHSVRIQNDTQTFDQLLFKYFSQYKMVSIKGPGNQFGEIAMEQKCPRTATVLTKTAVDVGIITHELFQKLLGQYKNILLEQKITFLTSLPLFKQWQRKHQIVLLNSCEEIIMQSGITIYSRGQEDTSIYIIVSGEVEVCYWEKKPHHQLKNNQISELVDLLPSHSHQKKILGVYSYGQLFGDHEFKSARIYKVKRQTEARAKVETKVFKIKFQILSEYFKLFSNQNELLDYFKIKQKYSERSQVNEPIIQVSQSSYKIDFRSIKEQYYGQDDEIKQLEVNKYSFVIPFREHPLNKEAGLVKSERKRSFQQRPEVAIGQKESFTPFTTSVFSIFQGQHKKTTSLEPTNCAQNTPKSRNGRILSHMLVKKQLQECSSPSKKNYLQKRIFFLKKIEMSICSMFSSNFKNEKIMSAISSPKATQKKVSYKFELK